MWESKEFGNIYQNVGYIKKIVMVTKLISSSKQLFPV